MKGLILYSTSRALFLRVQRKFCLFFIRISGLRWHWVLYHKGHSSYSKLVRNIQKLCQNS